MSDKQVKDNTDRVKRAVKSATEKAAVMIGGTIEGHAKELAPTDTGLLKNSITYAIGGKAPNVTSYKSNDRDKNNNPIEPVEGTYEGEAPQDSKEQVTVYVGSNVQYAPYQELGAPNINLPARPFLRPAFENYQSEIDQILDQCYGKLN